MYFYFYFFNYFLVVFAKKYFLSALYFGIMFNFAGCLLTMLACSVVFHIIYVFMIYILL
jgi:hypothetical protein